MKICLKFMENRSFVSFIRSIQLSLHIFFQTEMLQEVIRAVGPAVDVYVDGGVRSGEDVFKCMCLGAKCVFIGRPVLYALAEGVGCSFVESLRVKYVVEKLTKIFVSR